MHNTSPLTAKLDGFEPQRFGDAGNFWVTYDCMAAKFDKDTIEQLNAKLDVLLIFAGLFSAVNTAFIVPSLNNLSAGPADQTNHLIQLLLLNGINKDFTPAQLTVSPFVPSQGAVRQNSFFIASLGCSLLAAAGAVLAKQWLQYYERMGHTGPIREQGMERTKKFIGAKKWGLVRVVESLPGLLLISLGLFATALVDYLWGVHRSVAMVFSAFGAVGSLAFIFTVLVGAIYEACPFQMSFSRPLRNLYHASQKLPKDAKEILEDPHIRIRTVIDRYRPVLGDIRGGIQRRLRRTWQQVLQGDAEVVFDIIWIVAQPVVFPITAGFTWIRAKLRIISEWGREGLQVEEEEWISARSAIWMAETAPELDNIIIIAQNLPLASRRESLQLIAESHAFRCILYWLRSSLLKLRGEHRRGPDVENAVALASAVAHIVLADRRCGREAVCRIFEKIGSLDWLVELCEKEPEGLEALMIHLLAIARVFSESDSEQGQEVLLAVDASLRKGLGRCIRTGAAAATHLHHFVLDAPFNPRRWGDTWRKTDEISKTLLTDNIKVDAKYVICASWALSLTLRASHIFLGESLDIPDLPLGDEASVWAALEGRAFAERLLDVLNTFSQYYATARRASPCRHIYSPLLACQRQLLVHAKILNLSDGTTPQRGSEGIFQGLHKALNDNIREVINMNNAVLHPHIDAPLLQEYLHTLVDYLQELLLTPAAQWSDVSSPHLRITARYGRDPVLVSKHAELAEAILYRYFVDRSLYAGLEAGPVKDNRRITLTRDRRIGPVLISALRLYLGVCPSPTDVDPWPIFGNFLLFLATGQLPTGDQHTFAIDLIPSTVAVLPGVAARGTRRPPRISTTNGDRLTPALNTGLDFRRSLPRISVSSLRGALDDEDESMAPQKVEKTLVDVCRVWDLSEHALMGSGMIWLAESIRHKEAWVTKVDVNVVIKLFVMIMRKQREAGQDVQAYVDLWSSADVEGAGALFLRARQTAFDISSKAPAANPDAATTNWPGWTDTATIEAFATWLPLLDSSGRISIKERDDDMSMVQTTIELNLVTSFIDEASRKNPEAVENFGLDSMCRRIRTEMEAMERIIDAQAQAAAMSNPPQSVPEPGNTTPGGRMAAFVGGSALPSPPSRSLDMEQTGALPEPMHTL
ncbi:hypothetical protein FRB98_008399 [Tulasnella sp. 332]|nr:hypothetical protein FRB98_008399 [Tulasnella sp. 332]